VLAGNCRGRSDGILDASTEPFCVIVEIGAVMVNGSPDILVKIHQLPMLDKPLDESWARLRIDG